MLTVAEAVAANLMLILRTQKSSNEQLRRQAELPDGYISKLLNGTIEDPAFTRLDRLAKACCTSLQRLVNGYEPEPIKLLPSAFYALHYGLADKRLVTAMNSLIQRFARESRPEVEPSDESTILANLQVTKQSGWTQMRQQQARQQQLEAVTTALINHLCYYLEADRVSDRLLHSEFVLPARYFRSLRATQRRSVLQMTEALLTASYKPELAQPTTTQSTVQRIEWLIAELQVSLARLHTQEKLAVVEEVIVERLTTRQRVVRNLTPVLRLGISERALSEYLNLAPTYLRTLRIGRTEEPGIGKWRTVNGRMST